MVPAALDASNIKTINVTGFDLSDLTSFKTQLNHILDTKQTIVPIYINSYGGSVYNCLAMMNILESIDVPIMTVCESYAMSAGAVLLSCGDDGLRFAHPDAQIMVHGVSSMNIGTTADMTVSLEQTKKLEDLFFRKMDKNCKQKAGYFKRLIEKAKNTDIWMDAAEAKKHKLVNNLILPQIVTKTVSQVEVVYGQ